MKKILVGYITGTCDGNGHFSLLKAYNAKIKDGVPEIAGDYQFTLGQGGCDDATSICEITVAQTPNSADLATPSTVPSTQTDVTKRAQFRDKAGTLVDPIGFEATWYRLQVP